ncbi:beta-1,3-galactosyltransferase 1-like [Bemisia tabaci]|uniref:beta-1,3-galactosyltransferase 1-like n=1 Tax=Bemisia tabaci TaxID=7038 RepID=UPI003B289A2D
MLLQAPLSQTPQDEKRLLVEGGERGQRLPFWTTLPGKLALLLVTLTVICFLYLRAPVRGEDDPEAEVILYRPGNTTVETPSGEQPPHPLDFQPNKPDVVKYLKNDLVKDRYVEGFDIESRDLCPESGSNLKVLILVSTGRENYGKRMAIRHTWGHYAHRKDISLGFLIGRGRHPASDSKIQEEQQVHGDIILGRFVDTYANLTLKTTAMLEWSTTFCPEARYLFKADDDVFVNVPRILELTQEKKAETRAIFGRLFLRWQTPRDSGFKHYVSPQEYAPSILPDYVHGPGYLITGDIKRDLYEMALSTPFFLLEDCFFTGFIATAIGARKIGVDASFELQDKACKLRSDMWIVAKTPPQLFDLYKRHLEGRVTCYGGEYGRYGRYGRRP